MWYDLYYTPVNLELLQELGLSEILAKSYLALVRDGRLTPAALAAKVGTTRSNAYALLDKLVHLELAKRSTDKKRTSYIVGNPIALQNLAKKQRDESLEREKQVRDRMPLLLNYFYTFSEQPGVRYFQGTEGIKEIYGDQLRTGQAICFIRSVADIDFAGFDFMHKLRMQFVKHGIERRALTLDVPHAPFNYQDADPVHLLTRTWLRDKDYSMPVEWTAYGNKLSIISFGEEAIGMIIESPQIAESFRQLFAIMEAGLRAQEWYGRLPQKAAYIDPDGKKAVKQARQKATRKV